MVFGCRSRCGLRAVLGSGAAGDSLEHVLVAEKCTQKSKFLRVRHTTL